MRLSKPGRIPRPVSVYLRHLAVTDFRSYPTAELVLEPGVSVLVGANGNGKTNLVEAANYVATLGSHRVATDAPLIRAGAARAVVRAIVVNDVRELMVDLEITAGKANRARLNRAPVARPREVLGALRTVLFAPEDLAIVRGDPAERRRFLDGLLVARSPRFAGIRSDYERVLKQRNALLKTVAVARRSGRDADLRTLDTWDGHLAQHGAELLKGRLELVAALAPYVVKAYDAVSDGRASASITYRDSLTDHSDSGEAGTSSFGMLSDVPGTQVLEQQMLEALTRARKSEVERGVTLVGPHRDDLVCDLGALPVRGYASHGESWSFALALRLASYDLLSSDGGEPVLILDDVFAELDAGRRERLAALVGGATQLLITAAVPEDVPCGLTGARYEVATGQVRRVN